MGKGNYVDGKREGKTIWYYYSGEVKDENIYKIGICVELCEGDEKIYPLTTVKGLFS